MKNLILISLISLAALYGQDRSVIFNTSNPAYTCNIAGGSYSNYTCDEECDLLAEDYCTILVDGFNIDQNNTLLVNEITPRVHNSGHLTINAFNISQFENHIRAICGLNKVNVKKIANAEMNNILGNEIEKYRKRSFGEMEFFFDYGKKVIKDKRKMGHLTILKQ